MKYQVYTFRQGLYTVSRTDGIHRHHVGIIYNRDMKGRWFFGAGDEPDKEVTSKLHAPIAELIAACGLPAAD